MFLPVGHIWKFDLEQYEQFNFGVKWNFSKNRIEPVMLNFLATTENLRNTRSEQPNYKRGKLIKKSRHKNHTRVEMSYLEQEAERLRTKQTQVRSGPE